MNMASKKERLENAEEQLYIFSGILFHNQEFAEGNDASIRYDFSCPEYKELKENMRWKRSREKAVTLSEQKDCCIIWLPD